MELSIKVSGVHEVEIDAGRERLIACVLFNVERETLHFLFPNEADAHEYSAILKKFGCFTDANSFPECDE